MSVPGPTLYDELQVDPVADVATIRRAYRSLAQRIHPDHCPTDTVRAQARMSAINAAWAVLSDPSRRAEYDRSIGTTLAPEPSRSADRPPRWAPRGDQATGVRREAWFSGLRVQVLRLSREALRSAALALSIRRHGRPRGVYEAQFDTVLANQLSDTPERTREARLGGCAPLDLALGTALVGLAHLAEDIEREAARTGVTLRHLVLAELLDRTWDNLAHGITREVEVSLGGNPHLVRVLGG
ncbi:MAG TPA: hypothetical protein ENI86_02680 [Acidimicrobiales bacterium]|nr:hypothetical protein [Acidimicrobiales bacterium]